MQADLANPVTGAEAIAASAPRELDVLIYNIGIWEQYAFTEQYAFLSDSDASISRLVKVNITATLLLLKRLIPNLLGSSRPQVILTGSTSALRQSGRPEVTFGATKAALNGIANSAPGGKGLFCRIHLFPTACFQ
nr:SDR family NAD(P)-dependent oxidoreductase [Pseudomonas sp. NBRC 111119]